MEQSIKANKEKLENNNYFKTKKKVWQKNVRRIISTMDKICEINLASNFPAAPLFFLQSMIKPKQEYIKQALYLGLSRRLE